MKKIGRVLLLLVTVFSLLPLVTNSSIYASGTVTAEDIENNSSLPNGCYYFTSTTTYVLKNTDGTCGDELEIKGLVKAAKKQYYDNFIEMGSDANRFEDKTDIFKGIDYSFSSSNPLKNQAVSTLCSGQGDPSGTFEIKIKNKTYKFFIPCSTYPKTVNGKVKYVSKTEHPDTQKQQEGYISLNSDAGVTALIRGVKEGVIAGNIQKGFNIGSVYSTTQKSLNDVMSALNGNVSTITTTTTTGSTSPTTTPTTNANTSLTNTTGTFFKFKNGKTMKATMDYFMCPLFGKISLEELPKDDAAWNAKISELDKLISGDEIKINSAYMEFIDGTSPDLDGIRDSGDLDFTNGVKAYKDGLTTTEPLQKVNYNMRIAVPYYFEQKLGNKYKLKSTGLYVIPDYRMSVYNDTIYQTASDGTVKKVCTNADLELDRKYLAFFNQKVNGEPVGVVVVLRYNECVVDTSDSSKLYITGRKITFDGNYSSSLNLESINKEAMYYSTGSSGKQGVLPKYFAFSSDVGGATEDKSEIYLSKENHTELSTSDFVVYIDFATITAPSSATATPTATPTSTPTASSNPDDEITNTDTEYNCFVIVRNNFSISDDGQLLNWLATEEAKATNFVEAETLRKRIRGEFDLDQLTYEDWSNIKNIESELGHDKDGFLIHIIRTVSIIFGVLLIFFAILIALAYWFDIFNTFTDFSILYFISGKNMYPIADKDSVKYVMEYEGKTRFVTFKQVLFISALCCIAGLIFLNIQSLLEFFFWLYTYFMTRLGGM